MLKEDTHIGISWGFMLLLPSCANSCIIYFISRELYINKLFFGSFSTIYRNLKMYKKRREKKWMTEIKRRKILFF